MGPGYVLAQLLVHLIIFWRAEITGGDISGNQKCPGREAKSQMTGIHLGHPRGSDGHAKSQMTGIPLGASGDPANGMHCF